MNKFTTLTSARASLCALGEYLRRRCFFAPLQEQVKMEQRVVTYCPIEKLLDGLLRMRCGAKAIAHSHVTIKVAPAVQQAFGRKGCADQATIARTLHAWTAENIAQLGRVSWYYLTCDGLTPHHLFHEEWWWVDADVPPCPWGRRRKAVSAP